MKITMRSVISDSLHVGDFFKSNFSKNSQLPLLYTILTVQNFKALGK